jgi:hypothetical protein
VSKKISINKETAKTKALSLWRGLFKNSKDVNDIILLTEFLFSDPLCDYIAQQIKEGKCTSYCIGCPLNIENSLYCKQNEWFEIENIDRKREKALEIIQLIEAW